MNESLRRAVALARHGALTREVFGKPRGTRTQAAARKKPIPGHYYPRTPAWFTVLDEPLCLSSYLIAMWKSTDEEMRRAAVDVVGEFGDSACIAALGSMLHAEHFAVDSLPHANHFEDRPSAPDEGTRIRAAGALASIGGPEAEEVLWRALEREDLPQGVRKAALLGLLDLLTPAGWENYTFMNPTRARLPMDVRARFARLRGFPSVTEILVMFDEDVT